MAILSFNYLLIVIFICIPLTQCLTFFFSVPPRAQKCMGEYLSDGTTAIFSLNTDNKDLRVRLVDPNGRTVYTKVREF
jgi:hypothetical protein